MTNENINSFSVARLGMVAGYYKTQIERQLVIYSVITTAMFVLTLLGFRLSEGVGTMMSMLVYFVLFFMFYLGPLAFASEDGKVLATMLPARASEKFTAIIVYCLVVVPLVLFAVWIALWCLTFWWTDVPAAWELNIANGGLINGAKVLAGARVMNFVQELVPFATVLWVVMAARTGVTLKAFIGAFGSLMAMWIGGMIVGVICVAIMVRHSTDTMLEGLTDNTQLLEVMNIGSEGFLDLAFIGIALMMLVYVAFAMWKSYRLVAHSQV